MEITGSRVMVLGGWGLVGSAICRELAGHRPRSITLTSLQEWQAVDAVRQLRLEFPDSGVEFVGEWGNIFTRSSLKDRDRHEVLRDPGTRSQILGDLLDPLDDSILLESFLYQLLEKHRPDVIVDCVNSATAFAYQDIYSASRGALRTLEAARESRDLEEVQSSVEGLIATQYVPQLIRHVQILYNAMVASGTRIYLKIGTSGTGGMGLNIPYTHSEEHPSRILLSKSAIAGAHTLLLFLMARTPGGPIIKELKPAALIAWKAIEHGPISRRGSPLKLFDCDVDHAVTIGERFAGDPDETLRSYFATQDAPQLEAPYIDTGENGIFTRAEFEAVTMIDQMEFITPEEIARGVLFEILGGNTGSDMINALDQTCIGPTYRAGALRDSALRRLLNLEEEHRSSAVAFEMLGPPKLSKILYEAYILRTIGAGIERIGEFTPAQMSRKSFDLIQSDGQLRAQILSIGIPILLPDGKRLLRGPEVKIPVMHGRPWLDLDDRRVDKWAQDGWVDLRVGNMDIWKQRLERIIQEIENIPFNDSSSRYDRNADFWFGHGETNIGRIAGWIFIKEQKGSRMKS